MSMTMPINRLVKSGPETGKVPALLSATVFLRASAPARAMIGMIIANRPNNIAKASVVLNHGVLVPRPANALPLLPVAEL